MKEECRPMQAVTFRIEERSGAVRQISLHYLLYIRDGKEKIFFPNKSISYIIQSMYLLLIGTIFSLHNDAFDHSRKHFKE